MPGAREPPVITGMRRTARCKLERLKTPIQSLPFYRENSPRLCPKLGIDDYYSAFGKAGFKGKNMEGWMFQKFQSGGRVSPRPSTPKLGVQTDLVAIAIVIHVARAL